MSAPRTVAIALTFADGTLGVMQFVTHEFTGTGSLRWQRTADPATIDAEIAKSSLGQPVVSWRPLDPADLPIDRIYRNAWRDVGGKIEHDMPQVREIALTRVRRDRAALLTQLDADWMRATGQGKRQEADAVEARRQALRDRPAVLAASLASATTPEQVTALATVE